MYRKSGALLSVLMMAVFAVGCAITDYSGHFNHQTQSEAKLWGKDVAWITGDAVEGTYVYTVKYDNRGGVQGRVTINSYHNPVVGSFTRDGVVDQDGDDIQGSGGIAGGKFLPGFVAVDPNGGSTCDFFSNIRRDFTKGNPGPGIALCIFGAEEEVDKDLDLSDAFGNLDDLLRGIWSGAVGSAFTVELVSVTFGGTQIDLSVPAAVDLAHNGVRPTNMTIDATSPGMQSLLQGVLDNTVDGEATTVSFAFAGGLTFGLPGSVTMAFDHATLESMLQ